MNTSKPARDPKGAALAFAVYLVCTIVLTYPVAGQLTTALPNDPGDPVLETWILWWSTHVTPLTTTWWNSGFFYPTADVMTFSENLLGILPITAPVQWLTGNPVLAYNIAFLLSFALSGLGAYLLCHELCGRRDASFIAGLAFAFCPYRIDQLPHLQVLSAYWLPMTLFALHRYLHDRRARWLVLFAVTYVLQGLANAYLLLYIPVLVLLWVLWFVPLSRWRVLAGIAAGGLGAGVLLAPILLRYVQAHQRFGFVRSFEEIRFYSADLTAILSPSPSLAVWKHLSGFLRNEGQLFPGLTVVVLIVLAIVARCRNRGRVWPAWYRIVDGLLAALFIVESLGFLVRLAIGPWETSALGVPISVTRLDRSALIILGVGAIWALARFAVRVTKDGAWPRPSAWVARVGKAHAGFSVAVMIALAALVLRLAIGPWRVDALGIRLSVDSIDKMLSTLGWLALAWLLTTPAAIASRAKGSAFPFYVLAAGAVYLLAMGPVPVLRGDPFFHQAPYRWLLSLPGFEGLRVPTRIWIMAALCLAIAGGLAYGRLVPVAASLGRRSAVVVLLSAGILADGWISVMPTVPPPRRSPVMEQAADGPVIELPLSAGGGYEDLAAMYRSIYHQRPIGNGYSGHFPPHYALLTRSVELLDPDLPSQLAALGFRDVLVNRQFDPEHRLEAFFSNEPGVQRVAEDERDALFRLSSVAPAEADARSYGPELKIARVDANFNLKLIDRMVDGDIRTRWDAGLQSPLQEVVVELGEPQPIGAVVISLGPFTTDWARLLTIELSEDNQQFTPIWEGSTSTKTLLASVTDPKEVALRFPMGGKRAKFVRIRQMGSDPVFYWSIAKLKVLAPAP